MVVVLDSEYVFQGISCGPQGGCHREVGRWGTEICGNRTSGRGRVRVMVQVRWAPSHLKVPGNDGVDELARQAGSCTLITCCPCRHAAVCWSGMLYGLEPMPESEAAEVASHIYTVTNSLLCYFLHTVAL